MTIDVERAMAIRIPESIVDIERGRLRSFATAIGETHPVYFDVAAARAAGHPDLLAPPTFLFSVELQLPHPFGYLEGLGADLRLMLHGEQSFTYHAAVHAGDTISCRPAITEVYAKSRSMDFVVKRTLFTRGQELVGLAQTLIIVRHEVPE